MSGVIFLVLSYCVKSTSFWNNNRPRFIVLKDKIIQNVWRERKHSDFLQYLKFEFIQYTYFGQLMITFIFLLPALNNMTMNQPNYTEKKRLVDAAISKIGIIFMTADFMALIYLRLLLRPLSQSMKLDQKLYM